MKSRRLAVYGLTAGLLGGGGAGLLMTGTTIAGAQTEVSDPAATTASTADSGGSSTSTAPESSTSGSSDPSTTTAPATPTPAAGSAKRAKGAWQKSVIDGLVADGTITQAQADKILAALDAARPARVPGGKGHGRGFGLGRLDAAASALGMTADELRAAVRGGKTLAAIAGEKGVAVSSVVDALLSEMKEHLAQHVADGKKTQAEVDQMLADARTRIEAFVNGTVPAGLPGFKGGRGHGPWGGVPAAPSSATSGSGTVTS